MPSPTKAQSIFTLSTNYVGVSIGSSGRLMYTVTPGKKLFITSFNISSTTGGSSWMLCDSLAGIGATKYCGSMPAGTSFHYTFPTPLEITVGVVIFSQATETFLFCFNGWEEAI